MIYEIHACARGQWRTIATFNDPNAAVAEAVRLRTSRRHAGIRVIEAFQDTVDRSAARVVYRYTASEPNAAAGVSPQDPCFDADRSLATSLTRPKASLKAWSVGRFLPRLSIVIAAFLVLMTFSAA